VYIQRGSTYEINAGHNSENNIAKISNNYAIELHYGNSKPMICATTWYCDVNRDTNLLSVIFTALIPLSRFTQIVIAMPILSGLRAYGLEPVVGN